MLVPPLLKLYLNVFLSPMAPLTTFCTSLPTVTFLSCLLNDNMIDKIIIIIFFFTEISDMFHLILNHVISFYPNVLIKCKPLSSFKCENIVFVLLQTHSHSGNDEINTRLTWHFNVQISLFKPLRTPSSLCLFCQQLEVMGTPHHCQKSNKEKCLKF